MSSSSSSAPGSVAPSNTVSSRISLKRKSSTFSRVLDEAPQFYMKRTTYLANDIHRRVHAFESLADERKKQAKEINEVRGNDGTPQQHKERRERDTHHPREAL